MITKITIIVADNLIKSQLFNKIKPKGNEAIMLKLTNALFSKRWEEIFINKIPFKKMYLGGTKYSAVVHNLNENDFLLVFYRFKSNNKSKNISKYDNDSSEVIYKNFLDAIESYKKNLYIAYHYEKEV